MRVLLVEDNPGDATLVIERLQAVRGAPFQCSVVESLDEAIQACGEAHPDVVLLDMNLPDSSGLETVAAMRACSAALPIVVFTGLDDHDTGVEALRRGADDYLAKSDATSETLRRTLVYAVERRRLRLSLEGAVKSRDDLLRVVSHDLRNQMNVFAVSIGLLRRDLAGSPKPLARLELMQRAASTMKRLLDDLLDMAALDTGKLGIHVEPHDAAVLLGDAAKQLAPAAQERNITLRAAGTAPGLTVLADGQRVLQIIGNLVGNALRHTPDGGSITLTATEAGHHVRFGVTDTGSGIAPEDLSKLFDRFFRGSRARGEGVGLGLAITRALVEAQGGTISVESELGRGSTFHFTLPRQKN